MENLPLPEIEQQRGAHSQETQSTWGWGIKHSPQEGFSVLHDVQQELLFKAFKRQKPQLPGEFFVSLQTVVFWFHPYYSTTL